MTRWARERVCSRCGMVARESAERDSLGPVRVQTQLNGRIRDEVPGCEAHPMGRLHGSMPHDWTDPVEAESAA